MCPFLWFLRATCIPTVTALFWNQGICIWNKGIFVWQIKWALYVMSFHQPSLISKNSRFYCLFSLNKCWCSTKAPATPSMVCLFCQAEQYYNLYAHYTTTIIYCRLCFSCCLLCCSAQCHMQESWSTHFAWNSNTFYSSQCTVVLNQTLLLRLVEHTLRLEQFYGCLFQPMYTLCMCHQLCVQYCTATWRHPGLSIVNQWELSNITCMNLIDQSRLQN